MSVYNDEEYLGEAIESILNQSFSNYEFLIIDDASTDRSLDIIKDYAEKDDRIHYFQLEKNQGLTRNLNFLLDQSQGDYIARMDGNDISLPSRFEKQLKTLRKSNADMVWSNIVFIDQSGNEICNRFQPSLKKTLKDLRLKKNHIVHANSIYKKEVVMKLGKYNDEYKTGQDGDLWYRMLLNNCSFVLINQPLFKLRLEQFSITAMRIGKNEDINFLYANCCMKNFQKKKSITYIRKVKSIKLKTMLLVRFFLSERLIQLIKNKFPNDYDSNHKSLQN